MTELEEPDADGREVYTIEVDEEFQRQGVATAMWQYATEQGLKPRHSDLQSPEGRAWAATL